MFICYLFLINTSLIYKTAAAQPLGGRLGVYMGKARHFKTFAHATYKKINFSLDLFLQLYFKILKLLFLFLKNWDTKSKTSILFIFLGEQLKVQKKHTE